MELISAFAAEVASETAAEAVTQEALDFRELTGPNELSEYPLDQPTMETFRALMEQDSYRKLGELQRLAVENPDAARAQLNDIHVKGQAGEGLMESALSQKGEVRRQVPVGLDGAAQTNRVDLQLVESDVNLKLRELTVADGELVATGNYDVSKGSSASFEVKNGSLDYLRSQLADGHLQQQIKAGRELSDHSFVVINEDCARAMLDKPAQAADIIRQIHEAGGKLVVELPGQAVQNAILLS